MSTCPCHPTGSRSLIQIHRPGGAAGRCCGWGFASLRAFDKRRWNCSSLSGSGEVPFDRFPICSVMLKREPLNAWMESNFEMVDGQGNMLLDPASVVLGFDWSEHHRVSEFQNEHPSWRCIAPMKEEPIWDKCRMQSEAVKVGLPISDAYTQGFPHNNCGKRCVRAGISHWVHLLEVDEPAFAEWESEEIVTDGVLRARGIESFSMLKDRRGGVTRPLYLYQLRERVNAGEKFDRYDWGGCGCGGATK